MSPYLIHFSHYLSQEKYTNIELKKKHELQPIRKCHGFAKKSLLYSIPVIIKRCHPNLKEKIHTRSLSRPANTDNKYFFYDMEG